MVDDTVSLHLLNAMVFIQHGAPPHFARIVINYLDGQFNRKLTGKGGPIVWPARSPDLTPCDYFLWGDVKEGVYVEGRICKAEFSTLVPTLTAICYKILSRILQLCIQEE